MLASADDCRQLPVACRQSPAIAGSCRQLPVAAGRLPAIPVRTNQEKSGQNQDCPEFLAAGYVHFPNTFVFGQEKVRTSQDGQTPRQAARDSGQAAQNSGQVAWNSGQAARGAGELPNIPGRLPVFLGSPNFLPAACLKCLEGATPLPYALHILSSPSHRRLCLTRGTPNAGLS